MSYIPDCNNPEVRRILPTLCSYSPEIQAQICERQPSLCVPVDYEPSIWEPIWKTVEKAAEPFGQVFTGASKATLGIGETVLALPQLLTLGLIVTGIYLVTQGQRK
jgi:hypothetical protein